MKTGALIQNVFTAAKVSALLGLALFGVALGRNAQRAGGELQRNISGATPDWARSTRYRWSGRAGGDGEHTDDSGGGAGGIVVLGGCVEQRHVTAGEVKNPNRNLPLSLALGTGVVIALYIACNFIYLLALPLDGTAGAATILGRGIKFAAEDRVGLR